MACKVQLIGGSLGQFIDIALGPAAGDYSSSGNVIVTLNSSGKVVLCGAGGLPVGVLMNAPVADAIAIVRIAGLAPVKADGTGYAVADKISSRSERPRTRNRGHCIRQRSGRYVRRRRSR